MIVPQLEFVFAAEATLAPPIQMGTTYEGQRRIIPILNGSFAGPDIKGTFMSFGASDWQFTRHDGVIQAEANYALETDDGVIIQISNYGLRHGPAEVMQSLSAGETVDPGAYYFRTNARFIAPEGKYDWLNKAIFVASGARYNSAIKLGFYKVI